MKLKHIIPICILFSLAMAQFANASDLTYANLNIFGAHVEGGAYFNEGCCGSAGIRLPDSRDIDFHSPSFSLSFSIPPKEVGAEFVDPFLDSFLRVEVDWAVEEDSSCEVGLPYQRMFVFRHGAPP